MRTKLYIILSLAGLAFSITLWVLASRIDLNHIERDPPVRTAPIPGSRYFFHVPANGILIVNREAAAESVAKDLLIRQLAPCLFFADLSGGPYLVTAETSRLRNLPDEIAEKLGIPHNAEFPAGLSSWNFQMEGDPRPYRLEVDGDRKVFILSCGYSMEDGASFIAECISETDQALPFPPVFVRVE